MMQPYASTAEKLARLGLVSVSLLVLLFLIVPVLVIIPLSFNSTSFLTYPMDGFSFRWYEELMSSQEWRQAFKNSFIIAPFATLLAMVFGTMASVGLCRGNFRGKGLVMAFLISPMIVPLVIVAVGLYFFFARLQLLNSYIGLILAHAMLGVPFVVITVNATLQGFNINLSRAAASLGAPPLTVFFKVVLPLIAPALSRADCLPLPRLSMRWWSPCSWPALRKEPCPCKCSRGYGRTSAPTSPPLPPSWSSSRCSCC